MRKIDDERLSLIREKLMEEDLNNKFNKHLGLEILELNQNYIKTRIKYTPEVLNTYGTFHGGALLSLADVTGGTVASMCGYYVTTVSCSLNFLLPATNTEYIYCECMKLKSGKHILVFDVRITDDKGSLLDSGEFSYFAGKTPVLPKESEKEDR